MKIKLALLLALLLVTAGSANAWGWWDGERQGFLLGFGMGAGFDSYSGIRYDPVGLAEEDNDAFAIAMSPRIGYAISNQVALYYSRHPFIYKVDDAAGDEVTITSCIEALQVQYFLAETAPSLYFAVGAGVGYFMDFDTSNYSADALKGFGMVGTIGVEPIKHLSAELSLHYKSPQSGASDFGVSLLVNVLGY